MATTANGSQNINDSNDNKLFHNTLIGIIIGASLCGFITQTITGTILGSILGLIIGIFLTNKN